MSKYALLTLILTCNTYLIHSIFFFIILRIYLYNTCLFWYLIEYLMKLLHFINYYIEDKLIVFRKTLIKFNTNPI